MAVRALASGYTTVDDRITHFEEMLAHIDSEIVKVKKRLAQLENDKRNVNVALTHLKLHKMGITPNQAYQDGNLPITAAGEALIEKLRQAGVKD